VYALACQGGRGKSGRRKEKKGRSVAVEEVVDSFAKKEMFLSGKGSAFRGGGGGNGVSALPKKDVWSFKKESSRLLTRRMVRKKRRFRRGRCDVDGTKGVVLEEGDYWGQLGRAFTQWRVLGRVL